ncbi:hypothetical protein [Streptomyces sp. NEAU-W12]|uniref:hypothetical protein n=1 Tax=Streptomyces sp. NEAU-W12 TaxID=2994668 RepID=UPI00224B55EA|nr:hypothetical protein [Streptomyces sp. NEAU-W12]MCX2928510.1 hypothetical protein [Streptomyces sp. NEAU-W12]
MGEALHDLGAGPGRAHQWFADGGGHTLLLQQVLAEPAWAKKLPDEDRRGLTALFWSNINPYGTFRLEMDRRLDLGLPVAVPRPRTSATADDQPVTEPRHAR